MTNDLTTPEGSLQQLIDDLENNLQEKGVQNAIFDSTTGIRGLVAKILNIESLSTISGLKTSDIVKYQGNSQKFYVKVYKNGQLMPEGGNVVIKITNSGVVMPYTRPWNGNEVNVALNMNPGEYPIETSYTINNESFTTTNNVKILPVLLAEDLTKYCRQTSKQFEVLVLDNETGNPIGAGVDIKFNLKGVFYTRTTNASGIAKLNINVDPGEYLMTIFHPSNTITTSNKITVLPTLSAENLTLTEGNSGRYIVNVINNETGEPINSGVTVQFNMNGVFYNRTVTNGTAILNILPTLSVGTYTITATRTDINETITNTITIEAATSAEPSFEIIESGVIGHNLDDNLLYMAYDSSSGFYDYFTNDVMSSPFESGTLVKIYSFDLTDSDIEEAMNNGITPDEIVQDYPDIARFITTLTIE